MDIKSLSDKDKIELLKNEYHGNNGYFEKMYPEAFITHKGHRYFCDELFELCQDLRITKLEQNLAGFQMPASAPIERVVVDRIIERVSEPSAPQEIRTELKTIVEKAVPWSAEQIEEYLFSYKFALLAMGVLQLIQFAMLIYLLQN